MGRPIDGSIALAHLALVGVFDASQRGHLSSNDPNAVTSPRRNFKGLLMNEPETTPHPPQPVGGNTGIYERTLAVD